MNWVRVTLLSLFAFGILRASSQMTITTLRDTTIKGRQVKPIRILGHSDYFYFAGFADQQTGCLAVDSGTVYFNKCDRFIFDFAAYYNNDFSVPLYYIRRLDGKYLSFQRGSAMFVPKITGAQVVFQQWLVAKAPAEDSAAFFLLLPQVKSEYAYVLKIFDNNTEMGFSLNPKMLPSESQFFIRQTPKNMASPLPAKPN